jgi:hypothetical protein
VDEVRAPDATPLAVLLDEELAFDATTTNHLSNHLPMALVALARLGADDARLAAFANRYRHRLAPVDDVEAVTTLDGWLAARGRRHAYGAVRPYLERRTRDEGADAVLGACLPHLVDGISGAAFHGVIRLAYSLESASDARVAAGLAYLTQVHQPLGPRTGSLPRTADPVAALGAVAGLHELGVAASSGNIGQRLGAVGAHRAFAGVVDWLEIDDDTPRRLTEAAIALYAATDDFTALHGVTASHALSIVAPYVEDRPALASWWFQALAAAYVTIGAPSLHDPAGAVAPWLERPPAADAVASRAIASDDEHVVKLVYSARALEAIAPTPLLGAVAARQAAVPPATTTPDRPAPTA